MDFGIPRGPTGPASAPFFYYTYNISGGVYTNTGTKRQYLVYNATLTRVDMYLGSAGSSQVTIALNKSSQPWVTPITMANNLTSYSYTPPTTKNIDQGEWITIDIIEASGVDLTINILLAARL